MSTESLEHPADAHGADAHTADHPSDAPVCARSRASSPRSPRSRSRRTSSTSARCSCRCLITLMTIKFLTVVAYFMHLKFDAPILRKAFYAGLILALLVYLVALSTFHFWGGAT